MGNFQSDSALPLLIGVGAAGAIYYVYTNSQGSKPVTKKPEANLWLGKNCELLSGFQYGLCKIQTVNPAAWLANKVVDNTPKAIDWTTTQIGKGASNILDGIFGNLKYPVLIGGGALILILLLK